jgi:hypothetical protein
MTLSILQYRALAYQADPDAHPGFSHRKKTTLNELVAAGLITEIKPSPQMWDDWKITSRGLAVYHEEKRTRDAMGRVSNPLSMGGATERNVLIGVAAVGLAALAYEMFKSPAPVSTTSTGPSTSPSTGSSTPSGPSSSSAQPYLITVPMSGSATDPAMPVPSGATIQVNAPAGGTGGFTAGLVSSPTSVSTDASGNAVTDYTVIAASGTSGSYAWTSSDGSSLYSIPINVT